MQQIRDEICRPYAETHKVFQETNGKDGGIPFRLGKSVEMMTRMRLQAR